MMDKKQVAFAKSRCFYPCFRTAILGCFSKGVLVQGQMCELKGCRFDNDIAIPEFTAPKGQVYTYENPTLKSIAKFPKLPDPWEQKQVRIDTNQPKHASTLPDCFTSYSMICTLFNINLRKEIKIIIHIPMGN